MGMWTAPSDANNAPCPRELVTVDCNLCTRPAEPHAARYGEDAPAPHASTGTRTRAAQGQGPARRSNNPPIKRQSREK
eukprot:691378-Alexandrium_andersonii.AAC.1